MNFKKLSVNILCALSILSYHEVSLAEDQAKLDSIYDLLSVEKWQDAEEQLVAADDEDPVVLLYWGIFYGNQKNPKHDKLRATVCLEKAASKNNTHSKILLVGRYLFNADPKLVNYNRGIYWAKNVTPWLEKGEKEGDVEGIKNLAMFYLMGIYKEKDAKKALILFERAASAGDAFSMEKLGYMYQEGIGTEVDELKSAKYRKLLKEK